MRTIFHIDVNSAYLSWTSVENLKTGNGPDLREIPAIIGGDQKTRHGVVLAKSIPAKKFGIHTGEPVVNALKKCPNLVMAPPNHDLYHAYSCRMMDFLHSLTPDIEQVSIDECFLDFTGISHRYPSPYAAARYIKDEIHGRFGFTVSVFLPINFWQKWHRILKSRIKYTLCFRTKSRRKCGLFRSENCSWQANLP